MTVLGMRRLQWAIASLQQSLPLFFLSCCFLASAHAVPYTVAIEGAGPLTPLLTEHLDISRHASDTNLPSEEIQRLAAIAPKQIRDLLATEGYFSPVISYELDKRSPRWTARFQVDPGLPVRVDAVDIRFKGDIASGPNADEQRMTRLRRRWSLDPGEVFRQSAWDEAKNALLKNLLIQNYPAAGIAHSEARIDPKKNSAALSVEVDSGPAFAFGELHIQGLQRYSRNIIDAVNPIQPGDPYTQEKLNELQARLEDTGYFRSVFATVEVDPARPLNAPVNVTVVENQRKRLSFGLGFSTDAGARVQSKWQDRNFLQRNWRLESELRVDRETRLLGGDVFLLPLTNGWQPSVGAHLERTLSNGESNDKLRAGARLASPNKLDEKIWALAFMTDRQRIGDTYANNRQALIASFTYIKRRLDQPITPRRGYIASVELGAGPRGLINETNIGRVVIRGTLLAPVVRRWNAVLRGLAGQVFGGGRVRVPDDLLFRTGGDQSVRGYAYNTLGVQQDGAIVGGTVTAVLSAELIYQFTPQWGAAIFTDAGNAADSWHEFQFKHGSGVGARWRSPIGPVNLDIAYGHATHQPRLHFSVGYGF